MVITEQQRGVLFVLVGPGGAGKNTLMKTVINATENLTQLATATTRQPREDETQGIEHLFISLQDFKQMIQNGELLEWQEVTKDRFYGIPRESVESHIKHGKNLIADIEVLGAKILKDSYGEHILLIFVTVPGTTIDYKVGNSSTTYGTTVAIKKM